MQPERTPSILTLRPAAVLFDRDGTLVYDHPYNGDPAKVVVAPDARASIDRLRERGLPIGVLTNQSGVGRGLITLRDMERVNDRVEELLGAFDGWFICPHAPQDDCECRKPKPKLIFDAADAFGVDAERIVVVGDRNSDLESAHNAGAIGLQVDERHTLARVVKQILTMLDVS